MGFRLLGKGVVQLYTNTSVAGIERGGDNIGVVTNRGRISCDILIHATNAYASKLLPQFEKVIKPVRGQVILTAPLSHKFPCSLSFDDGYEYIIQREDGRAVIGGMRWKSDSMEENTTDDGFISPVVGQGLREVLPDYFPPWKDEIKVEKEWTGIMAYTRDMLPLVGPVDDGWKEYIIAGFSGNGMPKIFASAKSLSKIIEKKEWVDGEFCPLYSSQRFKNEEKNK